MLSEPFLACYLDWFAMLRADRLDEVEVPALLDAAVAELEALHARYHNGRISEAGLAYGPGGRRRPAVADLWAVDTRLLARGAGAPW